MPANMALTTCAQPCRRWANLAAYPAPYRRAVPAQPAPPGRPGGRAWPLAEDLPTTTAKPTPPLAQHGLRQLRAPGSDSGRRQPVVDTVRATTPTPAILAVWLLAASARLTNSPGSDTADAERPDSGRPMPRCPDAQLDTGHRTRPTPDSGHPDAWTPHRTLDTGRVDTARVDTGPHTGHWTSDAAETGQADKARPAPDILGHHAERLPAGTPNRVPADGACGARRPMQARR